ncbi:hypothetical protein M9H77_30619 [Catharanthus roseus]|uniref:Uncharacterized protein n=1 Tax=Catharanthus roseus TaxID=4058 RepID=A0ACC0A0E2_CATRO|nr:hypothetical protein M9H77_30619 [Catharanthus roseus]
MEYTRTSSVTTSIAHSVYDEGRYRKMGLFMKFIDHISKKRMENKDSILNLVQGCCKEPHKKGEGEDQEKKRRAARGDSGSCASSCPSCNERKRKVAARRPQFKAANLRSSNEKLFGRKKAMISKLVRGGFKE